MPGLITAGVYLRRGSRDFWNVRRADPVLVVDCTRRDGTWRALVVEVADPDRSAVELNAPLAALQATPCN